MNIVDRNYKVLKWFNFFVDFRLYAPVAIIYFSQVTGSYALGLSIFSITNISSAILEVPTGILSDYVGRKKTVMFGAVASTFALLFYALGGSVWILAIGAILEGLSRSFYSGNNDALLYDTLLQEKKEEDFPELSGKTGSMFQFALAISALVGGFVADFNMNLVVWISVIPQFLSFILSTQFIEPKVHDEGHIGNIFEHIEEAIKRFRENGKLRTVSLSSIIGFGVGESIHQFQPAFIAMLWPVWAIGVYRFTASTFASVSFWFSGTVIKKFSELQVLLFGTISSRLINFIALGFANMISPFLIALTSFNFGLGTVSLNTLLQKEFTQKQRATMGSLNSLFGSLFFAVFALGLGAFADRFGVINALILAEIILILQIFLIYNVFRKSN